LPGFNLQRLLVDALHFAYLMNGKDFLHNIYEEFRTFLLTDHLKLHIYELQALKKVTVRRRS